MARPVSDEESQLKRRARRRLIGAIVLVAAIVVVLPMVLDTTPKPLDGEVSIKIPSPDSSKFSSRTAPAPPSAEPRSAGGEKAATDTKSTSKFAAAVGERPCGCRVACACPQGATRTQAPALRTGCSSQARCPRAGREPAGRAAVPRCRSLRSPMWRKWKAVQAQMAAVGLQSYTEVVKTAKGNVTRVRAGPYPEPRRRREGARSAQGARASRQHRR